MPPIGEISAVTGVPEPIQKIALTRKGADLGAIQPLDETILAYQQGLADEFFELKIVPRKLNIAGCLPVRDRPLRRATMTLVADLPKQAAAPGGPRLREAGRWLSTRLGGALPLLLPATIIIVWQAASSPGLIGNRLMPAPTDVRAGLGTRRVRANSPSISRSARSGPYRGCWSVVDRLPCWGWRTVFPACRIG